MRGKEGGVLVCGVLWGKEWNKRNERRGEYSYESSAAFQSVGISIWLSL